MLQKKKKKLVNGGLMGGSNQLLYLKKEFGEELLVAFESANNFTFDSKVYTALLLNGEPKRIPE